MIKIQIPATSANIGSGFDSLGLALNLYNDVYMEEHDGVLIESLDNTRIPRTEKNLIYKTAKHLYELCGKPFHGLHIKQTNRIPMTRGLGSSSACIVGGLVGANNLMGKPLTTDELVDIAAQLEGHPDNSTPAILGGLVTSVFDGKKVHCVKQRIVGDLKFVTFIPNFELKTEVARQSLPNKVSHKDAVFNLSRAALMSVSLYSGNYENLKVAADDRLHQPYRLKLIPNAERILQIIYDAGAYAGYISGAGPTIMAIVDGRAEHFESDALSAIEKSGIQGWEIGTLCIDNAGTQVKTIQG